MASHKILVIDDSRVIRMRVRDMLPQGNFEVLEAKDGVEGLDAIREQRPNLIMLDFLLPRMSGWEVFQEIQNQADLQTIPLVVMSGRKEEVTEKISEPFEFFEFVEKPFEQKDLIEAIKGAMVKARKPRPQKAAVATASSEASAAEIQALNEKIAKMQVEMNTMKKQMAQILAFVKQKLR
ncbi:MAG: response regulator [Cyanothece sp. SIO1E1]|nr:response regulator [Cyanothece sp. SIO1E1]